MNTKVVIVLQDWPQFTAVSTGLKLLNQIHTNAHVFTKPSPLGKRHTLVEVLCPINYWVIYKDTYVNLPSTHVKSAALSSNIDNTDSKSDIVAHWLPTAATLTIMDPNQPEPLMKLNFL
jgi:hypothetical protein